MSTRCISWGKCGRCVRLTTLPPSCAVVMKSGNLNFLATSGPLQACNGTALPFILTSLYMLACNIHAGAPVTVCLHAHVCVCVCPCAHKHTYITTNHNYSNSLEKCYKECQRKPEDIQNKCNTSAS
jgi:hypothetical protein